MLSVKVSTLSRPEAYTNSSSEMDQCMDIGNVAIKKIWEIFTVVELEEDKTPDGQTFVCSKFEQIS